MRTMVRTGAPWKMRPLNAAATIPETSDTGQLNGQWHAPHKFAAWLARRLRDRGLGIDVSVGFRPDGVLVLLYNFRGTRIPLFLTVGRFHEGLASTSSGSLILPASVDPKVAKVLVSHTQTIFHDLFGDKPAQWLSKLPMDELELLWGPEFLSEFCEDLLAPGVTHWGATMLLEDSFDADTVHLYFGGEWNFRLSLGLTPPADPALLMGRYGILYLCAQEPQWTRNPLANYVGYVFSLRVPGDAFFFRKDPYEKDKRQFRGFTPFEDDFMMGYFLAMEFEIATITYSMGNVAIVTNGERECATCFRTMLGPTEEYTADLWHSPARRGGLRQYQFVDYSSADVASGDSTQGVTRLLRDVIAQKPDVVFLVNPCSGVIMGDSCEAILRESFGPDGPPVLTLAMDIPLEENVEGRASLWEKIFISSKARNSSPLPGVVTLVGYGTQHTPAVQELPELLTIAGCSEHQFLVPYFDADRIKSCAAAELTLAYPSKLIHDSAYLALRHCIGEVAHLAPPWGISATDRWLSAIRSKLTTPDAIPPLDLDELHRRFIPKEWDALRGRATKHRVGIPMSMSFMISPDSHLRHGVNLVELLTEMGFGVDLILLPPKGRAPTPVPTATKERWAVDESGADTVRVIFGQEGQSVGDLLLSSPARLVYSEVKGDERLLAAGKQSFSNEDLAMGYAGALRNLKRLLGLCETPFNGLWDRVFLGEGRP